MKKPVGWMIGALAPIIVGGAVPSDAAPLSLDDCVRLALRNNIAVEQAHSELLRARADVLGARSVFFPQLGINAGWTKSEEERQFERGASDETWQVNWDASLTLFDGWGNVSNYQRSVHARDASRQSFAESRQDVALESETRYFEVLKQQALLQVNLEAADAAERQLAKTTAMKDLGAATLADVYKAEVDFANTRLAVLQSERDLAVAEASLANYLGLDPREPVDLVPESLDVSSEFDLDAASERALEVNPKLSSAEASMQAGQLAVRNAKSNRYPSLSAFVSQGFFNQEPRDWDADHIDWQTGLRMNFTLFDGFFTKSNIRSAEASLLTARRSLETTELDVLLEVRRAYLDLEIARESITVAGEAVRSSEEDLRLAQERYNIGEGTILDVIDAQVNLTRSKTNLVTAQYDARLAVSALRNAVGDYSLPEEGP